MIAKLLADQLATPTTVRTIILADGTTYEHEVGPLSWIDARKYNRKGSDD